MSDCRLCVGIQGIAESKLVQDAVGKGEMTADSMLVGMRDSLVLGWSLRDASEGKDGTLCPEHAAQVKALLSEEEEG